MDISDAIEDELALLRQQRPDVYARVRARLRGWDADRPSDDYWVEVTRADHLWRVTSADDWDHVKDANELLTTARRQEMPVGVGGSSGRPSVSQEGLPQSSRGVLRRFLVAIAALFRRRP